VRYLVRCQQVPVADECPLVTVIVLSHRAAIRRVRLPPSLPASRPSNEPRLAPTRTRRADAPQKLPIQSRL
jgi:hypothetical protein